MILSLFACLDLCLAIFGCFGCLGFGCFGCLVFWVVWCWVWNFVVLGVGVRHNFVDFGILGECWFGWVLSWGFGDL